MSSNFIHYFKSQIHDICHHNHCFIQPFSEISHTDLFRLSIISQLCQYLLENLAKSILNNKKNDNLVQFKLNLNSFKELSILPVFYALFHYLEDLGIHMRAIHHDGTIEIEKSDSYQFKRCQINFNLFFLRQRQLLDQFEKNLSIEEIIHCTECFVTPPIPHSVPTGKSSLIQRIYIQGVVFIIDKQKMATKYLDYLITKLEPMFQKMQDEIDCAKKAGKKDVCIELPLIQEFLFTEKTLSHFETTILDFFPMFNFMYTYFSQQGVVLTKISHDGKFYFEIENEMDRIL